MNNTSVKIVYYLKRTFLLIVCLQDICACGKDAIPVSVHGVNYDESAFSFVLSDTAKPENRAGGELIEPFSAGGIMCCYTVPRRWHAGLKASVQWRYWLSKTGTDSLEEVRKVEVLEIPPYPIGKPAELWLLRTTNDTLILVSSDLQPDHPAWPSKIKGWPVPSLEFRRERWALYVKEAQDNVDLFEDFLKRLHENPAATAEEIWSSSLKLSPSELKGFSGPSDPKFLAYLETDFQRSLVRSKSLLDAQLKKRP